MNFKEILERCSYPDMGNGTPWGDPPDKTYNSWNMPRKTDADGHLKNPKPFKKSKKKIKKRKVNKTIFGKRK